MYPFNTPYLVSFVPGAGWCGMGDEHSDLETADVDGCDPVHFGGVLLGRPGME